MSESYSIPVTVDYRSAAYQECNGARITALAYLWGREDAGDTITADTMQRFSTSYGIHALRFSQGEHHCKLPLERAWKEYRDGRTIGGIGHDHCHIALIDGSDHDA